MKLLRHIGAKLQHMSDLQWSMKQLAERMTMIPRRSLNCQPSTKWKRLRLTETA